MGRKLVIKAFDPELRGKRQKLGRKLKIMKIELFKIAHLDETSEVK